MRFLLVLLATLTVAGPALATPELSVTATYEARMLLLKLADLRTDQVVRQGDFQAGARVGVIGAFGVIKPSSILVQSNGSTAGGQVAPGVYIQTERKKRRMVRFGPGPTDPLTGLLRAALQPGGGSPCIGVAPIYDGRQRYDLILSPAGGGALSGAQRNLGLQRTVACRMGFRPISGFSKGPPKPNPFLRGDPVVTFAYAPKGDVWVMTDVAVPTIVGAGHVSLTALRIDGARPAFTPLQPRGAPRRPAPKTNRRRR